MTDPNEWVVPCPTCDAAIGEPCVDKGALGTPVGSSGWHITRWTRVAEVDIDRVQALTRARLRAAAGLAPSKNDGTDRDR